MRRSTDICAKKGPVGLRVRGVVALVFGGIAFAVLAQTPESRGAAQWLAHIQRGGQNTQFVGTVVTQQGGQMGASRIVHMYVDGVSHERVQPLDGIRREFLRTGNEVRCLWPDAKKVIVEWHPEHKGVHMLNNVTPEEVLAVYELNVGGLDRVAGQPCQVIELVPKDQLRYHHELCVDLSSGLLLSTQMSDERGTPLERMAFAQIRIGSEVDPRDLEASWSTQGWQVERSVHHPANLEQSGWFITPPPGFKVVNQVRRILRAAPRQERSAMQAVYSDGMVTFSVFIEPDSEVTEPADKQVSQSIQAHGATHVLSRTVGEATVTVIGEVPARTVEQVAHRVQFRSPR